MALPSFIFRKGLKYVFRRAAGKLKERKSFDTLEEAVRHSKQRAPIFEKEKEKIFSLRGKKAQQTREDRGVVVQSKNPVSFNYKRGEVGERVKFENKELETSFKALVKKWQENIQYQNNPDRKLVAKFDKMFMDKKYGFANTDIMKKARGDVSTGMLNAAGRKSYQGYPQTGPQIVGTKGQQGLQREKAFGNESIRKAFAGDKKINIHHAAGKNSEYRLRDLSYDDAVIQQDKRLTGGSSRIDDALEPTRDRNNSSLEKLFKESQATTDPIIKNKKISQMQDINIQQDKILDEAGDLLVVKKYNPEKNIVEFVGSPKNSLDPDGLLFGDKLIKNFTLEDTVLADVSRKMRKFKSDGTVSYKAREGETLVNSMVGPGNFKELLEQSLNKFLANPKTGKQYYLKPQKERLGKLDPAETLFNVSKDWNVVRQQISNNVTNRFMDSLISNTGTGITRPGFGLKDGGKVELNEGGTSGIELPSFDEFLQINTEQHGLIGEDAIMESIKDFFKSRGRPNYAKGGSIRELRGGSSYNNDVGMFQSIFSGIGAGIIDIPRGAFSLGASLVDLGLGTNSAARVEKFFDDLTTLDEKAEATTAGKITRIMTNLGIPGTYAFKAGSTLAKNALTAKKAGSYWKPTKTTAGQLEKTLTNKGRMLTTLGGAAGIGISDAIFVGDAERVGTLGDAFNIGPTQLAENDENVASRTVMNRVKFGLDSALLGGIIGGTGTAISQAVKRSNNLNRNNDFIDKILEYTTPQGKKTKEFFEMEREMIGLRSADVNRAQELHRQIDKQIDALYPFMARATGFGVQKERDAVVKVINDALVSSKNGPKVTPIKEDGVTIGANFTLGDMSEKALQEVRKLKLKDPDEIIRIMQQSRNIMDASFTDIGSNIFKFGKGTKEAAADTLERFDKFRKAFETKSLDYINDTYQIFGNKNSEALKSFRPAEEAITNAKELFKQLSVLRTGKKLTDEEAAFEVERILESSRKQNKFLTEGEALPLIKDESGFLKDIAVKDWNKEYLPLNKIAGEVSEDVLVNGLTPRKIIDDLFGKVEDPSATILSTLGDLSLVRRKHEFFGDLFNTMNGKQFFADRRDAARVFGENNVGEKPIQMLATNPGGKLNIEAVNPLNGMYTSKGIQEALEGVNTGWTTIFDKDNMFTTFYNNFILYPKATSQLAKTVLSPITHARNLISAAAFSAANGIIPLMNKEALDEAMGAFTQVGARGSEAANKRYRELLRLGVVNKNARLGDLEDLLADVSFGSKASQIRALRSFTKAGSRLKEVATDAYTAEDDFWKIFTFASERSRIDKALQKAGIDRSAFATSADNDLGRAFGSVDEYLDEAAANIVRNNVPNYDYVSKFIKDLRRAPLGNFVSFPAEIIRTSVNILGKGLKEFNYIDPITKTRPFRSIGMQRMAGFGATAVAIPYGTVEAFKAAYNVSGVEMDALRRFVPDWSKNSTLIPIKDDDGNFKYIDFSHANAYDTMIRPFKTIMNAVADGRTDNDTIMEDLLQGVVESTSELGSPFISESIWTQSVSDIFLRGGRTRDGRRLYTEQTPFGDRVAKAIYHMTESQLPGSLAQGKRLLQSVNKDPDKYGRTYDLTDEIGGIAGLRAVAVDPVTSMKFKIASFRTGINNARREFTSPLLRGGAVTPEQIVDRYKIANESLYKVQKEMAQDYYGAQILGASPKALRNEFKDRVSDAQLRSIIRGDFKPFIPSENIEQAFRDNAAKIGQQDPYRQARTTINQIARQYSQLKLFSDFLPDIPNPFSAVGVGLPDLGITQSSLPRLNTNINSLTGGGFGTNTSQTIQKGQRVFGSNDPVFGG